MTLDDLNVRFARPDVLQFEPGEGGLIRAVIRHPAATGEMYLHGGHVSAWQPRGQRPVLWMSQRSQFEPGKPIRGGVPLCFPWFGAKPDDPTAPSHGLARLVAWEVDSATADDRGVTLQMSTRVAPHYHVTHAVTFAAELSMTLTVENRGEASTRFEAAQHSYFAVGDIHRALVTGLEQAPFLDQLAGRQRIPATGEPITFSSETDRIYLHDGPAVIEDGAWGRAIRVEKAHSRATVVWNPWIAKAARMPDFGDDEWPGMLCVETANVGERAVTVAPGERWWMRTGVSVATR